MDDRERQLDSLEQRLRQWGANERARTTSVPSLAEVRGRANWPWWIWAAPAAAASIALIIGLVVLFQMRTGPSSDQLAQNAATLASLREQCEELEGELATLNEAHREMFDSQIALKDDLASSRKRIVELETLRDELKRMNAQLTEEMAEFERVHEDQLASLSADSETLVATNEAFIELMQWKPTTLPDCQGFIRDKQLLARGKAIINAFPDTALARDASAIQSYLMRVTLAADDAESIKRLAETLEDSAMMSHYEHLMIDYGKDPEVFLWLVETKAVLTEVMELA